jgi:N-methylhydantoinase B
MDTIERTLLVNRIQSICGEMGGLLQRTALSPNIRDRLDFSCAVFDADGLLCAQAAHIPVHLGSMAFAMQDIVQRFQWRPGDTIILNDPYLGGTHLPDITLVSPVIVDQTLYGFVANRAHHADIGAVTPGSMPVARTLAEEGYLISPSYLLERGRRVDATFDGILEHVHAPLITHADLSAQSSTNERGVALLSALINNSGPEKFHRGLDEINDYAEQLALAGIRDIPEGTYEFQDYMDDDGAGTSDIPIRVKITVSPGNICMDFTGTSPQVTGNINCPLSVTAAAVYYTCYCLMPEQTPACAGSFRPIRISAPRGSLVNAAYPAAVAAGNVETSTRIVDVVLGALAGAIPARIPAASHGSMNNVALGTSRWDYYETLGGGMGGGPRFPGGSAVQTHMTNTLNTPVEILEMHYPIRIQRYQIRRGSGGQGQHRGGDGIIREFRFLEDATVTLLCERRLRPPWGLQGGAPGQCGINLLNNKPIPGKTRIEARAGDSLCIATAGGGGWGNGPLPDS